MYLLEGTLNCNKLCGNDKHWVNNKTLLKPKLGNKTKNNTLIENKRKNNVKNKIKSATTKNLGNTFYIFVILLFYFSSSSGIKFQNIGNIVVTANLCTIEDNIKINTKEQK